MKIKYFVCQSIISLFFTLSTYTLWAQIPNGYYDAIEGKKDKDLKTALYQIISNNGFKVVGYSGLWDAYKDTDARPDGKVWDMYSNTSNFTFVTDQDKGSGGTIEGDKYNREHSFPQSWFEKASGDMKSDLFNVYPTDKLVNNKRSNYPYGETNGEIYKSDNGFSKLGTCTFPGYSGTVFEPNDQYKGDFARIYMYMVTCYENFSEKWTGNSVNQLDNNTYPVFEDWTIKMLLEWCEKDPVDDWEIARNDKVYKIQGNRNPFVDHPELAEYIWGDKTDTEWYPEDNNEPAIISPKDKSEIDLGMTAVNYPLSRELLIKVRNPEGNISLSVSGTGFSVTPETITAEEGKIGKNVTLTYTTAIAGRSEGNLTVSCGSLVANVDLKAEAVEGIPALQATDITKNSFTANWINPAHIQDISLTVYQNSSGSPLPGFPKTVDENTTKMEISGLTPDTEYSYNLSGGGLTSNTVTIRTLPLNPHIEYDLEDGDLLFTTITGYASDSKRIQISGTDTSLPLQINTESPFELSGDQQEWNTQLVLPAEGGLVYVRLSASEAPGNYSADLTISSSEIEEEIELLSGVIEIKKAFSETFENGTKGSYNNGNVECSATEWYMENSLIGTQSGDKKNGKQSARIKGSIEMAKDKPGGIGMISLYGANFSSDNDGSFSLFYSTGQGTTWKTVQKSETLTNTLQKFTYIVNEPGNIRIKIVKDKGNRINIDDIEISDYDNPDGITRIENSLFKIYSFQNELIIESLQKSIFAIYDITGAYINRYEVNGNIRIPLSAGVYLIKNLSDGKTIKININR